MKRKRSIARRYFKSVALVVLCSMILLVGVFLTLASRFFRQETLDNMSTAMDSVATVAAVAQKTTNDPALLAAVIDHSATLVSEVTGASLLVTDGAGRVLYSNGNIQLQGDVLSPATVKTLEKALADRDRVALARISNLGDLLKKHYHVMVSRLYNADGAGYLLALSDASQFSGYLSELISAFLWAGILMLLLSGVLALIAAQRISAPLTQISQAADRFGRGDFSVRVSVEKAGNDEIAQLAANFNTMATNLETIDRSRQSFMGNIAHELRTPMTSIKGFVDGMLDGVIPEEQYPRYLALVSDEVARLTRLIQSMLDITKLEAGEYTVNARSYDIWETLGAVLMTNEQRLTEGRIGIGGYIPQRTLVYADSDLISQVVYNIVDNAIKFTPPGGRIDLAVSAVKDRVYVSIRNTGEGIPADQMPHLFERFYKGDKSRGIHAAGAGLGMHISKVLIGVSGGGIRVDSDSQSWTEFTFDLPQGRPELPPRKERGGKHGLSMFRSKNKQ